MKKLAATLAALLVLALPAQAQLPTTGVGAGAAIVTGGGGGYTGPGDIATFDIWWSCSYAYNTASLGAAACQICNVADVACSDVNFDGTTGIVPNTPVIGGVTCGTTVGVNLCTIKKFYNKGAGGSTYDITQSTIADRQVFTPSCFTGIPCGYATAANYDSANYTRAQPFTAHAVTNRNASTGTDTLIFNTGGSAFKLGGGFFGANNNAQCTAGTALSVNGVTDATWYNFLCVLNSTSSNLKINATDNTGDAGTNGISAESVRLGGGGNRFQGYFAGGGIAPSNISGGNLTSINSNAHTVLGF